MKKVLVLVIVVPLTMGGLFIAIFTHVPLGEPKLRIEFYPPPWQMRPEDSFEVSTGVANDAWLLAWAKDVRVTVSMPQGFTNSRTGTNECELPFFTLHGGDGLGNGLTTKASSNVSPGNYTITFKISGENVPERAFTKIIIVRSTVQAYASKRTKEIVWCIE